MNGLQRFAEDVWIVDGPRVRFFVAWLPTRMVIVRLADGSLWIHSPVAVPPATLAQIEALGPVRHLVAPTPMHRWRLETGRTQFPQARIWEPADLLNADRVPPEWADELDQVVFRGNLFVQEVEFFHRASRSLILTDFVQNYSIGAGPFVPPDIRWTFTDRKAARHSLREIMGWPFDALIVAHGACLTHGAYDAVARAFSWLTPVR